MSNDPRSTNDIRLIAQDVAQTQATICSERRARIDDRVEMLMVAVAANTKAATDMAAIVADMAATVATLMATITQLAATVASQSAVNAAQEKAIGEHDTKLAVLTTRVTVVAGIVGSLPTLVQWVIKSIQ